jgi:hypothetical protein
MRDEDGILCQEEQRNPRDRRAVVITSVQKL